MDFNSLNRLPQWEWPDNAAEIVLQAVCDKSRDLTDRIAAVEFAGDCAIITDRIAAHLLNILEDDSEPERIREKAAVSLGPILEYRYAFETEAVERALSVRMLQNIQEKLRLTYINVKAPMELRRRCLETSVRSPLDWHAEAIRGAYAADDERLKITAVYCMGFVDGFEVELEESLASENPAIANEAAKSAGNRMETIDWFDTDDPLDSGEPESGVIETALLQTVPGKADRPDYRHARPQLSDKKMENNDDILDALHGALTRDQIPWDDEFMNIDADEDDDFRK